jgi:hypothetical protein
MTVPMFDDPDAIYFPEADHAAIRQGVHAHDVRSASGMHSFDKTDAMRQQVHRLPHLRRDNLTYSSSPKSAAGAIVGSFRVLINQAHEP